METVDQIREDSSRQQARSNLHRERASEPNAGSAWGTKTQDDDAERILVLEAENLRLRQLIAELLVRNQQVRELSGKASEPEDAARPPDGLYARIKV